ncbi:hypothetical protein FGO68_gene6255 [Halteria grandinella]|uniref:Uncharacterized protein n=1 Tax=Halteria grandinella TaxID=5974 RepID=A0A8J8NUG2_HALGN|nr:hypothetical protein FGO68_gene6255 [Halteria grandinella]
MGNTTVSNIKVQLPNFTCTIREEVLQTQKFPNSGQAMVSAHRENFFHPQKQLNPVVNNQQGLIKEQQLARKRLWLLYIGNSQHQHQQQHLLVAWPWQRLLLVVGLANDCNWRGQLPSEQRGDCNDEKH